MTTNGALARSYLTKARVRLLALAVFLAEEAYSDVIREAQELVDSTTPPGLSRLPIEQFQKSRCLGSGSRPQ